MKVAYVFDTGYTTSLQKERAKKVWDKKEFAHLYELHTDYWSYLVELIRLLHAEPLIQQAEVLDEKLGLVRPAPKTTYNYSLLRTHLVSFMNYHCHKTYFERPSDVKIEDMPYEFWQTVREVSDWSVVKDLLHKLPNDYMERYLNEFFPTVSEVQRRSELKIIHNRTEWANFPKVWMDEVFG